MGKRHEYFEIFKNCFVQQKSEAGRVYPADAAEKGTGLAQRFDSNYANRVLERLGNQTINLTNTNISLEEYFSMMVEIK